MTKLKSFLEITLTEKRKKLIEVQELYNSGLERKKLTKEEIEHLVDYNNELIELKAEISIIVEVLKFIRDNNNE